MTMCTLYTVQCGWRFLMPYRTTVNRLSTDNKLIDTYPAEGRQAGVQCGWRY